MSFQLQHRESVSDGVRRVAVELLSDSVEGLRGRTPSTHQAVHEFRKRCKSIRGLLRLLRHPLRSVYFEENRFYRDLSRDLSAARDAQALLEALDRLRRIASRDCTGPLSSQPTSGGAAVQGELPTQASPTSTAALAGSDSELFVAVEAELIKQRDEVHADEATLHPKLDRIADQLEEAIERVRQWEFEDRAFKTFEAGLHMNYARARKAMNIAFEAPSSERFHEWRKRVKYHWHHAMLLEATCRPLMSAHRQLAESVGELLGEYHDCSVLHAQLSTIQSPPPFDAQRESLYQLMEERQGDLRRQLRVSGANLLAEPASSIVKRWRTYWDTWKANETDEQAG